MMHHGATGDRLDPVINEYALCKHATGLCLWCSQDFEAFLHLHRLKRYVQVGGQVPDGAFRATKLVSLPWNSKHQPPPSG